MWIIVMFRQTLWQWFIWIIWRIIQPIWLTVPSTRCCRLSWRPARRNASASSKRPRRHSAEIPVREFENTSRWPTSVDHVSSKNAAKIWTSQAGGIFQMSFEVKWPARMNEFNWSAIPTRGSPSTAPAMEEQNTKAFSVRSLKAYARKVSWLFYFYSN